MRSGLAIGVSAALAWAGCHSRPDEAISAGLRPDAASAAMASPRASEGPAIAASNGDGRGVVFMAAPPGSVTTIVREARAVAAAQRRALLIYVGASWCEPCQRFHQSAEAGALDSELPRLALLQFDADRDRDRLAAAGYGSKYIPLFALASPDGTASSRRVEGAIKGDGAVAFIVPRLHELLSDRDRDPEGR